MHRVLRPEGRLIVIDSDDGALLLEPIPPAFADALTARQATFRRRRADPFIGRRLPRLLAEAGFTDVMARSLVIDSINVGRSAFARIVLDPVADAIDADLLSAEAVGAAARAIRAWGLDERAFGMTTVLALGGTKR
jgi:hypothetical protein